MVAPAQIVPPFALVSTVEIEKLSGLLSEMTNFALVRADFRR